MQTKRKIIPYNPELKILAKELRRNMTLSEVLLWNELRKKQMLGFDFDRQRPIGNFIVDFYCKELQLAIEIDGDTHIYKYDYDEERQRSLEKLGIHFLRFEDIEVKKNMNNVLRVIEHWIKKNRPTPGPSREGNPNTNDLTSDKITISKLQFKGDNLSREGLRAKNQPTPGPSREGNPNTNDLISDKIPIPKLQSQGDNLHRERLRAKNQPTPGPSREGNPNTNDLISDKIPIPKLHSKGDNLSREGLATKSQPTPNPSQEGNPNANWEPDLNPLYNKE